MKDRFKVISAVYLILQKDGCILLSRRVNTGYCDGMYGLPSGHVEEGESLISAMVREAKEEIGLDVRREDLQYAYCVSRLAADGHRIDHIFTLDTWEGEPINQEPEKCDDLAWFAIDSLPDTIIPYVRRIIESIAKGERYGEEGWE
ncbi:NUDIX domain-containing protein [Patescibacteria group bacterium]|nr:NUDIX domain-containing protein [Patescibacteria group bacterium]MBP9709825.1 NUDIX domain-containing protein [Patescibacteria group bacterium]